MRVTRFAVSLLALLLTIPAAADVTIRTKIKSGGFKGFGAFEGSTLRSVQNDKSRNESDITYTGRLMRMMADKGGIILTRVDLDKFWFLNPAKKTYREESISQSIKEAGKPREEKEPEAAGKPGKEEKPTHRVKKSEFTVAKTGQKKSINGFSTEESMVRLLIEVEEIETKYVSTFKMETSVWATPFTPALKKAMDEELKFSQALMSKMGLKISPRDKEAFNPATMALMLGVGEKNAEETIAQMKKKIESINGFPIVTDSRWFAEEDPRVVTAKKEAAAKEAAADNPDDIDTSSVQGAAGSLFGNFAKKKMKENSEKKAAAREKLPAFSTYTEVLSIDQATVSAAQFDVPAGYRKVEK